MEKSLRLAPRLSHMDNFSLPTPKSLTVKGPVIHRPTYPGMAANMEHQNERENWNARWLRQIEIWQEECQVLLDQVEALVALIELAQSQIKKDPPE